MAKRERIEDLGRIAEKLSQIQGDLNKIEFFVRSTRAALAEADLDEVERRLDAVGSDISEAWHIARFGDADD